MASLQPTLPGERIEVLDAMRGFALVGILLANLVSFAGFHLLAFDAAQALPAADRTVLFAIDWLIEGKFYALFSLLLGVGFQLQWERAQRAGIGFLPMWYRRMIALTAIGLIHICLIWHGDILTLYSLLGMLLPIFVGLSIRGLKISVFALLTMPLAIQTFVMFTSDHAFWSSSTRFIAEVKATLGLENRSSFELLTSPSAREVLAANAMGAMQRPMAYLQTGRIPQVLGQFLLGVLLARTLLPRLLRNDPLPRTWKLFAALGLIASFGYAWIKALTGSAFSLDGLGFLQGVVYHAGSTLLVLGYAAGLAMAWRSILLQRVLRPLATLGRMALTNYITQSIVGILLFYGYGFSLMGRLPFAAIPLIAAVVLLAQWCFCRAWLSRAPQGPLEYVWRRLAYGSLPRNV